MDEAAKVKLTVNITPEELEELRKLAKRNGRTVTEELRRAITSHGYFSDAIDKGEKVLLKGKGSELREVLLR